MKKYNKYAYGIARDVFNKIVLDATYKAQKKYGFDMTKHEYSCSDTHNNEADAFKHAYLSWHLAWYYGDKKAKELGDMHENETPNAPFYERNMDLWNNAIGREIAYEMKHKLGEDCDLLGDIWASEVASRKIYEKMQEGELITNPFMDWRKYETMEIDRLKDNERVDTVIDFQNFDEQTKKLRLKNYIGQIIDNDWEIPSKENLDKRVLSGELIYVEKYVRANGTEVSGYYRRKPYYARQK